MVVIAEKIKNNECEMQQKQTITLLLEYVIDLIVLWTLP